MPSPRYWREIPARYRLEASRCRECDRITYPARRVCPGCGKREMEPTNLSRFGKVVTSAVLHVAPADLAMETPYPMAIVETPAGTNYLAIECNPRFNGASYPTSIAHKLDIPHWLARTFETTKRSLADLDLSGLEYDPATGEGVILVNWGPVLVGKLLVLLAGPPEVQERLALELRARLC